MWNLISLPRKWTTTRFLVPVGAEAFQGIVRSNKIAAFIVDGLKEETTEEKIVDKMAAKYDAPRETIAADVAEIINTLRGINALEKWARPLKTSSPGTVIWCTKPGV